MRWGTFVWDLEVLLCPFPLGNCKFKENAINQIELIATNNKHPKNVVWTQAAYTLKLQCPVTFYYVKWIILPIVTAQDMLNYYQNKWP